MEPLLAEPWILDVDTTIKPLHGHQEGAVLGYNPKKPGRPSHCYHTYSMASTRLVLDVDVCAGDERTSKHGAAQASGRSSIACRATCGRRFCAATAVSAMKASCARRTDGALGLVRAVGLAFPRNPSDEEESEGQIGRALRPLMAFVMVLSYSRQIFLRFFLDARMEGFLRGHVGAFGGGRWRAIRWRKWSGLPR